MDLLREYKAEQDEERIMITTTSSIYCHVFNQAQARASEAIASVLDFHKPDTDKGQPEAV